MYWVETTQPWRISQHVSVCSSPRCTLTRPLETRQRHACVTWRFMLASEYFILYAQFSLWIKVPDWTWAAVFWGPSLKNRKNQIILWKDGNIIYLENFNSPPLNLNNPALSNLSLSPSLSLSLYVYIRSYINKYQYKCVVVISGVTTWVRFTQVISAWKDMISVRRTPIPWGCQDVWHKSRGALHPSYSKCIFSQYRKKTTVKWNEICDEVFN